MERRLNARFATCALVFTMMRATVFNHCQEIFVYMSLSLNVIGNVECLAFNHNLLQMFC